MNKGKVWLVGAGPGDIGLLTLKGMEILNNAEVVVYDSLVGDSILSKVPAGAKLINVGKRADKHTMKQEQINEVLLEEAQKGYRVVRLKGGDPFLFGRGGEELELLTSNGIPYEVVPGVTSSIAVPAYNGIPVTHRDFCSSVHIITGHRRAGRDYDINFNALVETKGTLVFLMGISALADICKGLLDAEIDPDMPAAVLQKGTTADQKRVVATVATLKEEVDRQGIETPAIIVVGKVCALSNDFDWYERLPLAGWKVVVTRPKGRSSRTSMELRKRGAEVLELPSIATVPSENNNALRGAMEVIDAYSWLVFTSPTGAEIFFDELKTMRKDIRALANLKIAVIGQGTAKVLEDKGIIVDLIPDKYDGEALGRTLSEIVNEGDKILIPRARVGNEKLVTLLTDKGAVVDDVPTYDTVYEKSPIVQVDKEISSGDIDCVIFTSASTVKGFVESTKLEDYSGVVAACIGEQTKNAADSFGMMTYKAEKATIDSLIELVVKIKNEYEV